MWFLKDANKNPHQNHNISSFAVYWFFQTPKYFSPHKKNANMPGDQFLISQLAYLEKHYSNNWNKRNALRAV